MATDPTLDTFNQAGVCADACYKNRRELNLGKVRMQVLINAVCPFVAIKDQVQEFVFNPDTFSTLSKSIQSRVKLMGGGLDGILLRETTTYKSNLIFVNDKLVDEGIRTELQHLWSDGKAKDGEEFVPHYAWDHKGNGSLYDTNIINYDDYRKGADTTSSDSSSGSKASPSTNLPKWGYYSANLLFSDTSGDTPSDTALTDTSSTGTGPLDDTQFLMPMQLVAGATTSERNVNYSVYKRRPVFQGADFWFQIKRMATESTIQNKSRKMIDSYNFLDSNLGPLGGQEVGSGGETINGGVVQPDANGAVVDASRNTFDFNKQVYYIIEIGHKDEHHNYFIVICENSNPVCLHASTVPQLIKDSSGKGTYKIVTPEKPISRRLSTYEGATGRELIDKDILKIKVFNYLGKLIVVFHGHEDDPWIIERRDLVTPPSSGGSDGASQNPSDYDEETVAMVVPAATIGFHGGNRKMAFIWGYTTYDPQVTIDIPQAVHMVGVNGQFPSVDNILMTLGMSNAADRVTDPSNDAKYSQDAGSFTEWINGDSRTLIASITQPVTWKTYGKGFSPVGTPITGSYKWPKQNVATTEDDLSDITVEILNGDVRPVKEGEDRCQYFYGSVTLTAGNFNFPAGDPDLQPGNGYTLTGVITPICTGFRAVMVASGNGFPTQSIDVSNHVMTFNETWTAQDYVKVEHTGTLKFLLNAKSPPGVGQTADDDDQTDYIVSLIDKSFYVTVKAWYEDSGVFRSGTTNDKMGGYVPTEVTQDNSIIMQGLCHGGKINYQANLRTMECQVNDYMKVLQDQHFLNSPFFDSVRDFAAVYEILRMAGFKSGGVGAFPGVTNVCPAWLLQQAYNKSRTAPSSFNISYYNGNGNMAATQVQSFALPGSYSKLTNPMFRFKDGDKYLDAITKMATIAGKCVYFDRFGVFHYEDRVDQALTQGAITTAQVIPLVREYFWATPVMAPVSEVTGCKPIGNIAYNSYSWQRLAGDVYNQILVVSASPEGALLVAGDTHFDAIDTPSTEGFLGYTKQLLQMSGVYGSDEAVKNYVSQTSTVYIPPAGVSFETFGRSHLKALDVIGFVGMFDENNGQEMQPLRVTNISTEIDPQKNNWWSRFECEWIYQGAGVTFAPIE